MTTLQIQEKQDSDLMSLPQNGMFILYTEEKYSTRR